MDATDYKEGNGNDFPCFGDVFLCLGNVFLCLGIDAGGFCVGVLQTSCVGFVKICYVLTCFYASTNSVEASD